MIRPGSGAGRHGLRTLAILLLLFGAAWIPRVLALDAFVTADEPGLLFRSANFYQAIANRDFANTVQLEHPGVTVTWAGTLGFLQRLPGYAARNPGQVTEEQFEPWLRANGTVTPLELLAAGRWWIALWVALIAAGSYFPLRKLWGAPLACLGVLMLAWDPFLIALTRELHMDGLLAYLAILAVIAFLAWLLAGRQWRYLLLSAVMAGLALLSKSTTLILIPTTGLMLLVEVVRLVRNKAEKTWGPFIAYGVWILLAAATIFGLWPALWVAPSKALETVLGGLRVHSQGHDSLNFFFGRPTNDPGPLFYPVAFLFRTTPGVLFGLTAAGGLAWSKRWPFDRPAMRRSAFWLSLFAALFAMEMTLGAKMFDRYISPVFLALDLVATLGLAGMVRWLLRLWSDRREHSAAEDARPIPKMDAHPELRGPHHAAPHQAASHQPAPVAFGATALRRGRLLGIATLSVLLITHGLFAFAHYPYYFTYYNPLMGGSRTAPQVLFTGWGEGLDAAAEWLKQQPGAANMRVVSWYSDGPLSYFLESGQKSLSFYFTSYLFDADYVVLYANQWQRGLPSSELVDYYLSLTPVHVVRSGGLELARIYDVRDEPPPDSVHIVTSSAADFDDRMQLAAYRLAKQTARPGDRTPLTLYLKRLVDDDVAYNALLRLVAPDGGEVWRDEGWPAGAPTTGWPIADVQYDDHVIAIPGDAAPGLYSLMLSFYDPETAELLHIDGGVSHEVASLEVEAPAASDRTTPPTPASGVQSGEAAVTPGMRSVEVNASWDALRLTSLQFTKPLTPGQTLHVELSAEGQVDGSLKMSFRLVDSSGKVKAQNDQRLWPYTRSELELPSDAQPGAYTLTVVLYDQETLGPFPDSAGSFLTALSEIEVAGD